MADQSSFLRIRILIFKGSGKSLYNPKMKKTRMDASKPERAATNTLPDSSGLLFLYIMNHTKPAGGSRNETARPETRSNLFRLQACKKQFIKQDLFSCHKIIPRLPVRSIVKFHYRKW